MADFNVIADVSETLRQYLTEGFTTIGPAPPPGVEISDLQGNISGAPARLTLFLYEVVEDPSARNRPHTQKLTSPPPTQIAIRKPPVALLLRYMLTPWGGDRRTEQQILARAIQILYDGANLGGPDLQGTLAGSDDILKINMAPITLEDRTRVWNSVHQPYHLSVNYEVRVVNLDSDLERRVVPVRQRSIVPYGPGGDGP